MVSEAERPRLPSSWRSALGWFWPPATRSHVVGRQPLMKTPSTKPEVICQYAGH